MFGAMVLVLAIGMEPNTTGQFDQGMLPIRVSAIGHPAVRGSQAQRRLMAQRSAEVRAVRELARKLNLPPGERIRGFRYLAPVVHDNGSVTATIEYRRAR